MSRDMPPSSSASLVAESVSNHFCCLMDSGANPLLLVYIFVGSIILHGHPLRIIAGSIVGIVGVAYVVLEYIPSIEPPQNMRDADAAGWGAEQV